MKNSACNIEKIKCSTALNKLKAKQLPYQWDLNIYRGCAHACKYCYAIYSHQYLGESDFSKIFVKENLVEKLDKELSRSTWKREVVNIGGVTDSYQPIEAEMKLMPEILKVLIKHKTPAIISTKSDLILRDYELIDELSNITYVNIASTIITMDESIRQKIEPNCSPSLNRFNILKEFRKTNASTGLHTMPIIPHLTAHYNNIESLCIEGQKANVYYMLPGILYLRGATKKVFFSFIEQAFPDVYVKFKELYKTGGAGKEYKAWLYKEVVTPLMKKYEISGNYIKPMKEKMHKDQLSLEF